MASTLQQAISINRQAKDAIAKGADMRAQDLIKELEYFKAIVDSTDEADVIDELINARWEQLEAS